MAFLDWIRGSRNNESVPEKLLPHPPPIIPRSYSLIEDRPSLVLRTEADVRVDDALTIMIVVVDEIGKNPNANWQKYRDDFEKAVVDVRDAFASRQPTIKQPGESLERGDRIIAYEPFLYGGKPKSNPDTPGIVDSVYDNGATVSYHRVGMPPGNVPVEGVRHASEQDFKKYPKDFEALEYRARAIKRSLDWDR